MQKNLLNKFLVLAGTALALTACQSCCDDVQEVEVSTKPIPGSPDDFKTNVKDRVFFALNKSNITADQHSTLHAQATWLNAYPQTSATIEGHCDERGTREYNLALGNRRATSVKSGLVKHGVSGERLNTISFGKDKVPFTGPQNEETWAQQRVGITVIN